MIEFITYGFNLSIYNSSIMDWVIEVGYKTAHKKSGKIVVYVQTCDMELAFAEAQVKLKEYMSKEYEGY